MAMRKLGKLGMKENREVLIIATILRESTKMLSKHRIIEGANRIYKTYGRVRIKGAVVFNTTILNIIFSSP